MTEFTSVKAFTFVIVSVIILFGEEEREYYAKTADVRAVAMK